MTEKQLYNISSFLNLSGIGSIIQKIKLYSSRESILKVINYHSVFANETKLFEKQIQFFIDHFNIIKPGQLKDFYENNISTDLPNLLITFDDGSLSQYERALEVLEKHSLKAVFFIPSGILELRDKSSHKNFAFTKLYFKNIIGKRCEFAFMEAFHLKEIAELGHEIGSHTVTHCKFSQLQSPKDIINELTKSKQDLTTVVQKPVRLFAYPKGDISAAHPLAIQKSRELYDYSFFALRGSNSRQTPPWFLHRDCIHPSYPLSYVKSVLRGDFDCIYKRRMKKIYRVGEQCFS